MHILGPLFMLCPHFRTLKMDMKDVLDLFVCLPNLVTLNKTFSFVHFN